jgi:hypothetical protein
MKDSRRDIKGQKINVKQKVPVSLFCHVSLKNQANQVKKTLYECKLQENSKIIVDNIC